MFKTILVPVDLAEVEAARPALERAVSLAHRSQGTIRLVYVRSLERKKQLNGDGATAEREIFGVTHAEVGAYLLGLWGIPFPIVEAVAFHHRPSEVAPESRALVGAIHIASGLVELIGGLASAAVLAAYAWWAPILLGGAWLATHWLLRESAIWHDRNTDEVRGAQRDADYAYRLAVDPPASKELRLFGLVSWTIERFVARRTRLHELQYAATRLREKPLLWSMLLIIGANVVMFWALANAVTSGTLTLGQTVMFAQSALGTAMKPL